MRFARPSAPLLWFAVAALAVIAVGCGGDDDGTYTATPGGPQPPPAMDGDPASFRGFADLIDQAVQSGDAAFFIDRIEPLPYFCTETEVEGGALGGAEPGLCQTAGQELQLALIAFWQSEGGFVRPETLGAYFTDFLANARAGESDAFGGGEARLYALAQPIPQIFPERAVVSAVITAIQPAGEAGDTRTFRAAIAVHFERLEGRWVVRGALQAFFPEDQFFGEFFAPDSGPFLEVDLYP